MHNDTFRAIIASENPEGSVTPLLSQKSMASLPEGDLLVKVQYSSLNYKDALSSTGNRGVTRAYPHTPGIDAAGVVVEDKSGRLSEGDFVLVCGHDLGMNTSGGFGEYIRVPAAWAMPIPPGLSPATAMMLGTAGFTAGLGIWKMLHNGQSPDQGPILVTGAGGGLGSIAIAILAKLGFEVIASTGKVQETGYFKTLGASEILPRKELSETTSKLLLRPRWAGAIDTIGGTILENVLKSCKRHGNVAICGNALSYELSTSVYPFILNGINMLGVDSATCTMHLREAVWAKLANEWYPEQLSEICHEINLSQLPEYIRLILSGQLRGRVFINLS